LLLHVELTTEPLFDAIGREAVARTWVVGHEMQVTVRAALSEEEWSVTLYHEVIEAVTIGCDRPPESVWDFNEGDFEKAAHEAHKRFGAASPENLNRMLQFYGFREP